MIKRVVLFLLSSAGALCNTLWAATVSNPLIWSDVPDISVVRADSAYYMVSTTMHYAPGVPVMKSTDLANWRTVGYAYDRLDESDNMNLENGKNAYGKGSWASSIRYHDGYFYVLTPSYTTGKTHLYKTDDPENGTWTETKLPFYHDPSLFFDDDGTVWVFYGSGNISYVQLNDDASGVKSGGASGTLSGVNIESASGSSSFIVKQEGAHMEKVNGVYYLFTISWPSGKCRTEIVYKSTSLLSGFSGKIFLQNDGVAQGHIFDTPQGNWYAMLFRDSGPVGRIPYLMPVTWQDGWPVVSGGAAPSTLELDNAQEPGYGMVTSDEFDQETLPLEWQWNHNPDNSRWSLSANPGKLRITTGRVDSKLYDAKNTLTQRTFGPNSSGRISLDASGMNDGDIAGLAALQDTMGFVGITKSGSSYNVVMYHGTSPVASVPVSQSSAYFRIDFSMPLGSGTATFYYSLDGKSWTSIVDKLNLSYTLGMFVGYRFALFNYATKTAGGSVDFNWFKVGSDVDDEIWLTNVQDTTPQSPHADTLKIPGTVEAEDYDIGGQNKAYYDSDAANQGGEYREDRVDIVSIADATCDGASCSGYAVGYTVAGEWLEYTVNVAASGIYAYEIAAASGMDNSSIRLFLDDEAITDTIAITNGGDWDTYSTITGKTSALSAGAHILKLAITGGYANIDKIVFADTGTTGIRNAQFFSTEAESGLVRVRINGQKLFIERNGKRFDLLGNRVRK